MHYNCSFSTYRQELTEGIRSYSATSTLDTKDGYLEVASEEAFDSLGTGDQIETYKLITDESDFQRDDRVVIDSENYTVASIMKLSYPLTRTEITLYKQKQ